MALGAVVGEVDAVELVTVGQRRGLGALGTDHRSYAVAVDVASATVVVGSADDLLTDSQVLDALSFVGDTRDGSCARTVQRPRRAARSAWLDGTTLRWDQPQRRVARGQSIAFYDLTDTELLGGATARD